MLRYCRVCGKIHDDPMCRREYNYKKRDKEADKFRNSVLWREKREQIKERDSYCCRVCLSAGVLVNRDLSVHHIVPITANYDMRLDDSNLITLCRYHHEQAERGLIDRRELQILTDTPVDITNAKIKK